MASNAGTDGDENGATDTDTDQDTAPSTAGGTGTTTSTSTANEDSTANANSNTTLTSNVETQHPNLIVRVVVPLICIVTPNIDEESFVASTSSSSSSSSSSCNNKASSASSTTSTSASSSTNRSINMTVGEEKNEMPAVVGDTAVVAPASAKTAFPFGTTVFSPQKKEQRQPQQEKKQQKEETNDDDEEQERGGTLPLPSSASTNQHPHNQQHQPSFLPPIRRCLIVTPQERDILVIVDTDEKNRGESDVVHHHHHSTPHQQQQQQHLGTIRYQQFLEMIVRNTKSDRDDRHPQAIHNIMETIHTNGGRFLQPYHYNNYKDDNNDNGNDNDNNCDHDNKERQVEVVMGMDQNNHNHNDRAVVVVVAAAPQWCTMVDRNRIKRYILHSLQQSRRNFISTTNNNNTNTAINNSDSHRNNHRDSSSSTPTLTIAAAAAAAATRKPSPSSTKDPSSTFPTMVGDTTPTERDLRHEHVLAIENKDKAQHVVDVDVPAVTESRAKSEQNGYPEDDEKERKKTCTSTSAEQQEDPHNNDTAVVVQVTAVAATATAVVRLATTIAVNDIDTTCNDIDADSIRRSHCGHDSTPTIDITQKNDNEDQQQQQQQPFPAQQSSSQAGIDSTPTTTTTILNDFSKGTGVCGDDDEDENDTMMSVDSEGNENEDVRTKTMNTNNSSPQEKNKSALALLALVSASATVMHDNDDNENEKTLSEDSSYPVVDEALTAAMKEDTITTWEPYTMSTSTNTFTSPSSHYHRGGDPPHNSKDMKVHDDDDDDEQDEVETKSTLRTADTTTDRVASGNDEGEGEGEVEDTGTTTTVVDDIHESIIERLSINTKYPSVASPSLSTMANTNNDTVKSSSSIKDTSIEIDNSNHKKKRQLPLVVEEGSISTGITTTTRTTGSSRSEKKKKRTGKKRITTKDTTTRRQNNNNTTKRKKKSASDDVDDDESAKKKKKRSAQHSALSSSSSLVSESVSVSVSDSAAAVDNGNGNEVLVSAKESLEASTDADTDSAALQEFGCICRLPHNNDTHGQLFWIECGGCRSWWEVHPKCIGFSRKKAETINWNCSFCEQPATTNGDDDDEPVKKKRRSAHHSGSSSSVVAVAVASSSARNTVRSNNTNIDSDHYDNDNDDDVSDDDDDGDESWTEENRCSLLPNNNNTNTNTPSPAAAITTKKNKSTYTMNVDTYKTRQDRWTRTWNTFFQQLVAYKAQFQTTLVPKKHKQDPYWHLGGWVSRQRVRYKEKLLPTDRIAQLESIGFLWDASFQAMTGIPGTLYTQTQNDMWKNMFQQYTVYQEKYHTNTVFPSKGKRETQLLLWVKSQRGYKKNGKISQHRIDLLDGIGFVWSLRDVQWMDMYQQLVAYHTQHKSASVPIRCTQHPQLAKWVGLQRQCYKKKELSVARIKYLDALGFVWTFFDLVPWSEMYHRLVAYQQQHKSTLVPHNYPTDPRLSNWVKAQRQNYHKDKLSDSQIASLTALDFVWKAKEVDMLPWSAMYDRLVAFKHSHHGSTLVPSEYTLDLRLGHWVRKQRYKYKTGILLEKRMDLLNAIDFVWFVRKN